MRNFVKGTESFGKRWDIREEMSHIVLKRCEQGRFVSISLLTVLILDGVERTTKEQHRAYRGKRVKLNLLRCI